MLLSFYLEYEKNFLGTPRPYLTFIVGNFVQRSQCRHQIENTGTVFLCQNGPDCNWNIQSSAVHMHQGFTPNHITVSSGQSLLCYNVSIKSFHNLLFEFFKIIPGKGLKMWKYTKIRSYYSNSRKVQREKPFQETWNSSGVNAKKSISYSLTSGWAGRAASRHFWKVCPLKKFQKMVLISFEHL